MSRRLKIAKLNVGVPIHVQYELKWWGVVIHGPSEKALEAETRDRVRCLMARAHGVPRRDVHFGLELEHEERYRYNPQTQTWTYEHPSLKR